MKVTNVAEESQFSKVTVNTGSKIFQIMYMKAKLITGFVCKLKQHIALFCLFLFK